MLIFFMLMLYLLAAAYFARACMPHIKKKFAVYGKHAQVLFLLLFAIAALLPIIGAFLKPHYFAAPLRRAGNLWLGFLIYLFLGTAIWETAAMGFRKIDPKRGERQDHPWRKGGLLILAAVFLVSMGVVHTQKIRTVHYTVPVAASENVSLKIAFVTDLHMGCQIGSAQIARMVQKINQMDPDLVLFGGDMYDSDYDMLENPDRLAETLRQIHSRYGVYGVYGNHDVTETLIGGFSISPRSRAYRDERMAELLKKSNITMLEDAVVPVAGGKLWLVGRLDGEKSGRGLAKRKSAQELMGQTDEKTPVIVLEHEPSELDDLAALGADVVLSGHTHAGQFFPLTLPRSLIWKNAYGLKKIGAMESIVTSGVGVYGPSMRLLTNSEVVQIDLKCGAEK